MTSIPARIVLAPIRFYQRYISPSLPATCRYYPTCSAYAVEALQEWGALRGSWLAIRRLGRCQPWSRREHFDPVPVREPRAGSGRSTPGRSTAAVSTAASSASGSSRRSAPVLSFQGASHAPPHTDHGSPLA